MEGIAKISMTPCMWKVFARASLLDCRTSSRLKVTALITSAPNVFADKVNKARTHAPNVCPDYGILVFDLPKVVAQDIGFSLDSSRIRMDSESFSWNRCFGHRISIGSSCKLAT
jgi:hypothetical protein